MGYKYLRLGQANKMLVGTRQLLEYVRILLVTMD